MEYAFSDSEFVQRLQRQTLIGQDFVESAFQYWLEDNGDDRSPFPLYIHNELQECTLRLFLEWTFQIKEGDSVTAELLSSKFAEIIHKVGICLALSEDDRLTIQYPDLPRVGDTVHTHVSESETRIGNIIQRDLVLDADKRMIRVRIRFSDTGEESESLFDIAQ